MQDSGEKMPMNKGANRQLDCAVIKYVHQSNNKLEVPAYDTIRSPFQEGGKLPGVTGGKVILGDIDATAEALDRQTAAVLWHTGPASDPDVEVQSVNVAGGNAYVYLGGTVNVRWIREQA